MPTCSQGLQDLADASVEPPDHFRIHLQRATGRKPVIAFLQRFACRLIEGTLPGPVRGRIVKAEIERTLMRLRDASDSPVCEKIGRITDPFDGHVTFIEVA